MNEIKQTCPQKAHLEMYSLIGHADGNSKQLKEHLANCPDCRNKARKYQLFYHILARELNKPISNRVLSFAKSLHANQSLFSLFICDPQGLKMLGHGDPYRLRLLFTAQGEKGRSKLFEYNLAQTPRDKIILRFITDFEQKSNLVYLWNPTPIEYSRVSIDFPTIQRVSFNSIGAAHIPYISVSDLHEQIIYLHKGPATETETSFEKILKGILWET
jgi:hypothetical protein